MTPRPKPSGRRLARPRLRRRLAGRWKVAVLAAPAGSGKTVVAAQYSAGRDPLWATLRPEDRDPAHLLGSLLAAATRMRVPLLGRTRRLFAARRDLERDGGLLTASFLAELVPARGERLVVLDDLHLLAEVRDPLRWLERVIEDSGPRVRFLVACRGEPPLRLARWEAEGGVVTLAAADLDFTPREQDELLRRVFGLALPRATRAALETAVGGWAAGLALAARHLTDTGGVPSRPGLADAAPGPRVFAFLAEELIAPLPARLQRLLGRAALLDELDPEALAALMGEAAGLYLRREVVRRDLLIQRSAGEPHPRFHPLLRDFLLRSENAPGARERRRMLERLARHWMRRGDPARAIRTLADAGASAAAMALFDRTVAGRAPVPEAFGPLALDLARAAASGDGTPSAWVLLHAAWHARVAGRDDEAAALARRASDALLRLRRYDAVAEGFRVEMYGAILDGSARKAIARGEQLLRRLPASAPGARGIVSLLLGHLGLQAGEARRAREALVLARRVLPARGYDVEHAEVAVRLATFEFIRGRWDLYLALASKALPVYRRTGHVARIVALLVNMADACTYLGQEDAALAYLDEARTLLPRSGRGHALQVAMGRGRALSEKGSFARAADAFRAARALAADPALRAPALQVEVWHGILERRRGRLESAESMLARAMAGFHELDAPAWLALARMERALVRGLRGHSAEALAELELAARTSRRMGDRKELARNALFEARVRQLAGERCDPALGRALRLLQRESYFVLLRKEADVARPLLDEARVAPALLRPARAMLGAPWQEQPAAPRRRDRPARGAAAHARPPSVRLRLLGALEVEHAGRPAQFPRRASAVLAAFLVLRRGSPVGREELAEALWPEAAPGASRNRFDVALNGARQVLEPGAPARGPFQVLLTEAGLCRLVPGHLGVDVEEFERLAEACEPFLARLVRAPWSAGPALSRAEAASARPRLESALGAYGGDLMPGVSRWEWVEAERERLRERHHRLLLGAGEVELALGCNERAAAIAERVLAADPLQEAALRLRLRALVAGGAPAAAARIYRDFAARLARDLDAEPGPETVALARELAEPVSAVGGN
jgi:DNA-binding SARP family transcriptional activator/tetratricopeptide (TPR) repeat protein